MNISRFFVDRPVFAGVLSVLIVVAGLIGLRALPISEYPEVVPPSIVVPRHLSRRQPDRHRRNGGDAARRADQRRRRHALHVQPGDIRRRSQRDGHIQAWHRPGQGAAARAEPRFAGRAAPARGTSVPSASRPSRARPTSSWSSTSSPDGADHDITYLRNYATLNVKDRLARIEGVGQVQVFGAGDYSMRVWIDPQKAAEHNLVGQRHQPMRSARQNVQAAAGIIGASPSRAGPGPAAFGQRPGPPAHTRGSSATSSSRRAPTARSPACATSPASRWARKTIRCARCSTASRPSPSRFLQAPGSNAIDDREQRALRP